MNTSSVASSNTTPSTTTSTTSDTSTTIKDGAARFTSTPHHDLSSTLPYLSSYFLGYPVTLSYSQEQGRFCSSAASIDAGALVLQSRAYVKGVHDSYRKRVCDTCWKYHHQRGWTIHCKKCKQVFFCSKQCYLTSIQNQNNDPDTKLIDQQYTTDEDYYPMLDRGVHVLECSTLKRLSSMKMDKDTKGMIKLIIRVYYKEQQQRQRQIPGLQEKKKGAEEATLSRSSHHIINPTHDDFCMLIGHTAKSLPSLLGSLTSACQSTATWASVPSRVGSSTLSQDAFWLLMKKAFLRLFPPSELSQLFRILAQTESNAFGLYAPPKADQEQEVKEEPETKTSDHDSDAPPSLSSELALGLKVIGRCVYPSASYTNHSCEPNLEVFQTGSMLSVHAIRDIQPDTPLTISYINTNQNIHDRRAALQSTYHFRCQCSRCEREEAALKQSHQPHTDTSSDTDSLPTPRITYANAGTRQRSRKKNVKMKKKKIEAKKSHNEEMDIQSRIANIRMY